MKGALAGVAVDWASSCVLRGITSQDICLMSEPAVRALHSLLV